MILEFESAQRVRDTLHGVGYRMAEIVHGIHAPIISGGLVSFVLDAVQHRIAHV
jgi:hypothetical protein